MGEIEEAEEKLSSRKTLLTALQSDERVEYNPIRQDERFKAIMRKLVEN